MQQKTFAVVGGDLRQAWLAGRLAQRGHTVYAVLLDREVEISPRVHKINDVKQAVEKADVVVLPLPASVDGLVVNAPFANGSLELAKLFALLKGKLVLAGKTENLEALSKQYGVETIDYFAREELAVLNSIPTAEGALELAMAELPTTIFGTRVLITGFGRISRVLCRLLVAMGAQVTVAARRYSDFAWIGIFGARAVHVDALAEAAPQAELIFNTVPAMLFDRRVLSDLPAEAVVIDLASKPGGVDFAAAGELGVKTIWALSLPGKVAPISSGEAIKDTILNILDERSEGYAQ
ncbi:MAG: dipicolinate synthase subunit DpsA [Oscillospiraceae bacterium]|nr:dipicolinate synthase subunit DpsA [Oscillospiraceae bacterium]